MRNETKNTVTKRRSEEITKRNDEKYGNLLDNTVKVKRVKKK